MECKMISLELDSLEDNTINNNNNNENNNHKVCKTDDFKYCSTKANGFHCITKVLSNDKNDFCALTLLDLSDSELNSIPIEINDLKNLLILNISHNNVDKIGVNLNNNLLSKLIASFNRLTIDQNLINRIVESFPSLTDLNLSFQSRTVDKNEFTLIADNNNCITTQYQCNKLDLDNCQLKYINLSGNQLSQLNRINGCTTLHTIILHTNQMTTIPLFKSCQQLQVLDISNNCFNEQLLTGNNLDILFNNCPALKHLDMIGSGGFNARNVINRSQYLTVPVSERLIHFVDIGGVRSYNTQIAISNSFINSSVCVEVLSESELIIGLVNGTKFAPIIKTNFNSILETELNCIETKNDFLKNSILSMFRLLSDRKCENLNNVNIILAHLKTDSNNGTIAIKVATCGQWTTLRQVPLTATDDNNSCSPKIINLCSKQSNSNNKSPAKKCLREDNAFIADPICHELSLNADNSHSFALLMGINVVEDESITEEVFASKTLITLTDKLKKYTEVINSKNNYLNNCDSCDNHCFGANFLALAIHPKLIEDKLSRCEEDSSLKSSSSNTSDITSESEHSEKYRSWEYILEENHKCLFKKELEALKDMDTNKFDSISSRKLKSSHTPIISLQQFITRSDKLKNYDSNTFKVYKI